MCSDTMEVAINVKGKGMIAAISPYLYSLCTPLKGMGGPFDRKFQVKGLKKEGMLLKCNVWEAPSSMCFSGIQTGPTAPPKTVNIASSTFLTTSRIPWLVWDLGGLLYKMAISLEDSGGPFWRCKHADECLPVFRWLTVIPLSNVDETQLLPETMGNLTFVF